jgi:hypothetical protein
MAAPARELVDQEIGAVVALIHDVRGAVIELSG